MAYEFSQVEGKFETINEGMLAAVIPSGMSFTAFKEKLKAGELVLLTETPVAPVLVKDNDRKSWFVSSSGNSDLSPAAENALLARTNITGSHAGGMANTQESLVADIDQTYIPEPIKSASSQTEPKLKYEYCFEVACSAATFRESIGCSFELAKTQQEDVIGLSQTESTEHGTKYIGYTAVDEPKKLLAKVASKQLGISIPNAIEVKPVGTATVKEAFIPVVPSVQLGERLGLPTRVTTTISTMAV